MPAALLATTHAPALTLAAVGLAALAWLITQVLRILRPALIASIATRQRRRDRRQLYRMRDPERRAAVLKAERPIAARP